MNAASATLTADEVDRVAAQAVAIARASARVKTADVDLGPPEVHVGAYRTPVQVDPFAVPLEDKVALLLAADEAMRGVPGIGNDLQARSGEAQLQIASDTEEAGVLRADHEEHRRRDVIEALEERRLGADAHAAQRERESVGTVAEPGGPRLGERSGA